MCVHLGAQDILDLGESTTKHHCITVVYLGVLKVFGMFVVILSYILKNNGYISVLKLHCMVNNAPARNLDCIAHHDSARNVIMVQVFKLCLA